MRIAAVRSFSEGIRWILLNVRTTEDGLGSVWLHYVKNKKDAAHLEPTSAESIGIMKHGSKMYLIP